jgi:hypothetical protein
MTLEQSNVLYVRFPGRIEQISKCWYRAHKRVDTDVHQHPGQSHCRYFGPRCFQNDVTGEHAADQIPNHWNQADDRIEAEPEAGTGNWYRVVKKLRERANPARSGRVRARSDFQRPGRKSRIRPAHLDTLASRADIRFVPG